jgi:hypothetical protein
MATEESQSQTQKKGGGRVLVIGGSVVLIAVVVAVVLLVIKPWGEEPDKKQVVTAENVDEIMDDILDTTPKNIPVHYTVTQNSDWVFPDGKSESINAYVENDKDNETPVYFDIVVDETGETVYSSPVIELGARIEHMKLDKELEKGEYVCTMTYHLVDGEQNTLTTVDVGLNLIIKN